MKRWYKRNLVLALGLAGLVTLAGCTNTPLPDVARGIASPLPTPVMADQEWSRYTDPEFGYSFSYPPEVEVRAGKNKFGAHSAHIQFHLPGVTGYQGMVIRVEANPQNLPVNDMVAYLYQRSAQELAPEELLSQVEVITVAGVPALKTSILPTNTDFSVIFLYNGRVYILAPVHDAAVMAVDPQALELFYQILSTFKVSS